VNYANCKNGLKRPADNCMKNTAFKEPLKVMSKSKTDAKNNLNLALVKKQKSSNNAAESNKK
jgi:hypothetical protein